MLIRVQKNFGGGDNSPSRPPGRRGNGYFFSGGGDNQSRRKKKYKNRIKNGIAGGFVGFVWDKSGLALKNGIKTMAGVIDLFTAEK